MKKNGDADTIAEALARYREMYSDQMRGVEEIRTMPIPDALEYLMWVATTLAGRENTRSEAEKAAASLVEGIVVMQERRTRQ